MLRILEVYCVVGNVKCSAREFPRLQSVACVLHGRWERNLPLRLSSLITSRSFTFAANFSRSTTAAEAKRKAASSWLLSSSVMT